MRTEHPAPAKAPGPPAAGPVDRRHVSGRRRSRRGRQLRAQAMRLEGMSLREIGKTLGCNHQTVANDLRDLSKVSNLPVENRGSRPPEIDTEVDSAKIIPLRREA